MRHLGITAVLLMAALVLLASGIAGANPIQPSTAGWSLSTLVDGNNIHLSISVNNTNDLINWNGFVTKSWGDVDLGGGVVLRSLAVGFDGDPICKYSFALDNNSDQTKNFYQSALLQNLNVANNAVGRATAGVTVTDGNGDGVSATGLCGNGGFYKASYNTTTSSPQFFDPLITRTLVAPADCGDALARTLPWTSMTGPIADMRAEFAFSLSPYDLASGTSCFTVASVPEPGTIVAMLTGMLGLGGFALRRRKA